MTVIFAVSDIAVTVGALAFAYWVRFNLSFMVREFPPTKGIPPIGEFLNLPVIVVIAAIWWTVFSISGMYRSRRANSVVDETFTISTSVTLASLMLLGVSFFYRDMSYSRIAVAVFWLSDLVFIALSRGTIRYILRRLRAHGFNLRRVLIVGAGDLGQNLLKTIRNNPELGLDVIGFVANETESIGKQVAGAPVLGNLDDLNGKIEQWSIDQIFIALPFSAHQNIMEVLAMVHAECVQVRFIPDVLQFVVLNAGLEDLEGIPMVNLSQSPLSGWNGVIKRIMDVSLSLSLVLIVGVPFLFIALFIKLTSKGPIFFFQERMGLDGKRFKMLKFRSMYVDAENECGPVMAKREDPRVTPFGAWIRRWSLDELPQLLNVILGQMSLVGPRPERPHFASGFRKSFPYYMVRHKVKSGITGWAQVNGLRGSDTSIEKRLEFDLYYIQNWSLLFDLKILFLTLIRVRRNAY